MENITQEEITKSRNQYYREWRKKNKEKSKEYQDTFWRKKALEAAKENK